MYSQYVYICIVFRKEHRLKDTKKRKSDKQEWASSISNASGDGAPGRGWWPCSGTNKI